MNASQIAGNRLDRVSLNKDLVIIAALVAATPRTRQIYNTPLSVEG